MCDACKHANAAAWRCPSQITKNDWLFVSCGAGKRMLETTRREALSEQTAWTRWDQCFHSQGIAYWSISLQKPKEPLGVSMLKQPITSLLSMRNLWSQSSDEKERREGDWEFQLQALLSPRGWVLLKRTDFNFFPWKIFDAFHVLILLFYPCVYTWY